MRRPTFALGVLCAALVLPSTALASTSATLSAPGEQGEEPAAAIGRGGEAAVAWARWDENGDRRIEVRRRAADGTWAATESVAPGLVAEVPAVAVDDQGGTTVVFSTDFPVKTSSGRTDVESGVGEVYAPKGKPFGSVVKVGVDPASFGLIRPQIGVAASGEVIVAWPESDDPATVSNGSVPRTMHYAIRPRGGTFGPDTAIEDPGRELSVSSPQLSVGRGGDAVIVWTHNGTVASIRRPGGMFGPAQTLYPTTKLGAQSRATAAVGGNGAILVAVSGAPVVDSGGLGASTSQYAIAAPGSASFPTPRPLPAAALQAGGTLAGALQIAARDDGSGAILFMSSDTGPLFGCTLAALPFGTDGTFGTPQCVSHGQSFDGMASAAFDAAGTLRVTWLEIHNRDASQFDAELYASTQPRGGAFSAPTSLVRARQVLSAASVAAGAAGQAIVSWSTDLLGPVSAATTLEGPAAVDPDDESDPNSASYRNPHPTPTPVPTPTPLPTPYVDPTPLPPAAQDQDPRIKAWPPLLQPADPSVPTPATPTFYSGPGSVLTWTDGTPADLPYTYELLKDGRVLQTQDPGTSQFGHIPYVTSGGFGHLEPGTTYTLGIRRLLPDFRRSATASITFTTPGTRTPDADRPPVPKLLDVRARANSATLDFQSSDIVTPYDHTVDGIDLKFPGREQTYGQTSFGQMFVNGLQPSTTYTFQARAHTIADVTSPWATYSFKTAATPPPSTLQPPSGFVTKVTSTTADISWTPVLDAFGEQVLTYARLDGGPEGPDGEFEDGEGDYPFTSLSFDKDTGPDFEAPGVTHHVQLWSVDKDGKTSARVTVAFTLASPGATPIVTPVSTPTVAPTPTAAPTATPAPAPVPTPTATPIPTPAPVPTPTATAIPTPAPVPTPTGTPEPTATPSPRATPAPTPAPPIGTPTPTPSILPRITMQFSAAFGYIGGLSVITGSDFTAPATVQVGGKRAQVLLGLPNLIVAGLPAEAPGSYPLTVTTSAATSASTPVRYSSLW